ncbi:FecR domain-containing protein [Fulvivirgaceae bacterium PWU5]|uniref:FecR domain-containing protein n=1 Tax=Dawidia cretensis TaxID=2782350 RepID=A0AAP2E4B8_9BACT|nr:FecR domain-containing protein [Dawidia cretensis]MBT1711322.1 FecR domain-containing protein [Dawidia cretensis]
MQKDFRTLFQKWQSNEATDEETRELDELLKLEVHQKQLMNLLSDASVPNTYDEEITDERKRGQLKEVLHQIQRKDRSYKFRSLIRLASAMAATVILVVIGGLWFLNSRVVSPHEVLSSVERIDKRFAKLPDGTTVTLNEGSMISYNTEEFGKANREVILSGEAFFDVTHDPGHPFVVKTQQVNTTVLGTAFNISAYADKPIVITVVRGKVNVGSDATVFETLLPNQELVIDPQSLLHERKNVQADEKVEWMANYLILENVTMKEAAQMISKRYNTQVVLGDSSLAECRISIFFVKNESLSRVLETVSLAKGGDYKIQNNIATINGQCE